MIISEETRIRNVSREVGILAPRGHKYVPLSEFELNKFHSMVTSYSSTGYSSSLPVRMRIASTWVESPRDERLESYDYISFFIGSDQYYIDLLSIKEDIRSHRISCLIEE
jgi:hypothetical protein